MTLRRKSDVTLGVAALHGTRLGYLAGDGHTRAAGFMTSQHLKCGRHIRAAIERAVAASNSDNISRIARSKTNGAGGKIRARRRTARIAKAHDAHGISGRCTRGGDIASEYIVKYVNG